CRPQFTCSSGVADNWWDCWPCYYDCASSLQDSHNYRLPVNSTSDVKCANLFKDANMDTGRNAWFYGSTKRPAFNGWETGTDPTRDQCDEEMRRIDALVTPNTPSSPIDRNECNDVFHILDNQNTWAFEGR
ncbi:hypothetical protein PFISCL1PPCAC_27781, partial [Pristionchus fissidentatus]